MSAGREAAAFHEAGHCYVAVRVAGRVVESISIYQEEEGWSGKTSIQPDFQVGATRNTPRTRRGWLTKPRSRRKSGRFRPRNRRCHARIRSKDGDRLRNRQPIESARLKRGHRGRPRRHPRQRDRGRGREVRKLAELSQTAAQQISDIAKISVAVAENAAHFSIGRCSIARALSRGQRSRSPGL